MQYKTLFAFHQKSPEMLRPWLYLTTCCFDAQGFCVFIFIPDDGATEH
jgi:hypothetical protein